MSDSVDTLTLFGEIERAIPDELRPKLALIVQHMTELHADNLALRRQITAEIEQEQRRAAYARDRERFIGALQARAGFYKNDARLKQEEINRLRKHIATTDGARFFNIWWPEGDAAAVEGADHG